MMPPAKLEGGNHRIRVRAFGAPGRDRDALHALLAIASSAQQERKKPPQREEQPTAIPSDQGAASSGPEPVLEDALRRMAESVRAITGASGAAIAVARGAEMKCVASTGTCAIEAGASIDLDRGLAAKCVRSGEVQSCSDSESDPLVNREACRALGVRSMVMLPLRRRRQPVAGVLAVFSDQPAHFSSRNLPFLEFMAGLVLEAAERGQEPPAAAPPTEVQGQAAAEPAPAPGGSESQPELTLLAAPAPQSRWWIAGVVLLLVAVALGTVLWPELQSRLHPPATPQPVATEVRTPAPAAPAPPQVSPETPPAPAAVLAAPQGRIQLTAVRTSSVPGGTRVVLELDGAVRYQASRLDNPARLFFDLENTHLALAGRNFPADDPLLGSIRVAQNRQDAARVVLDLKAPADYSATLESAPPRLVIELRPAAR